MDATLKALADLLLQAVPTIIFFIFVAAFLKQVYFKPMARLLEERRKATEGVRELAKRAFEEADRKTSEFEKALELARAEIHKEHEALRRQWSEEQTKAIADTRAEVDRQIQDARRMIGQEAERAQAQLDSEIERLSESIVDSLLRQKAA